MTPADSNEEDSEDGEDEDEDRSAPSSSCQGGAEGDRVYRDLLARGAVPAVVGKKRKAPSDEAEVELELFTPEAAKKARLIPYDGQGMRRRASFPDLSSSRSMGGGSFLHSFFGM